jgi:hypothetical protein
MKYLALLVLLFATVGYTAEEPLNVGRDSVLAWDHSGLDVEGNVERLAKFQFVAWDPSGETVIEALDVPVCVESGAMTCEQAVDAMNLSAGLYLVRVRAFDEAGNYSDWGEAKLILYDPTPPAAPSGTKVKITITVELLQ